VVEAFVAPPSNLVEEPLYDRKMHLAPPRMESIENPVDILVKK
jgi:hypothetical protein